MAMRVLLADDHELMRAGLRALLEKQPDIEVVGEAGSGREAVELAVNCRPDVAMLDISMPVLNGIDAARQIVTSGGGTRVLMLSMHTDRHYVLSSLQAGAMGYLLKTSAAMELPLALAAVSRGNIYLSPRVADVVVGNMNGRPKESQVGAGGRLSPREREVLQLVAEGRTSKEIARLLHVTTKTVETHRSQLMTKLRIHSTAELTKYAVRIGLTSLDG